MEPHPHDQAWIKEQLAKIPPSLRGYAIERYKAVFEEVYNAHEGSPAQANEARREANTRLRIFIKKTLQAI